MGICVGTYPLRIREDYYIRKSGFSLFVYLSESVSPFVSMLAYFHHEIFMRIESDEQVEHLSPTVTGRLQCVGIVSKF